MRGVACFLVLGLFLPGCLEDAPEEAIVEESWPMDDPATGPPEGLTWSGSFTAAVGAGDVTGNPCDLASCDLREFTLEGTFDVEATLTWGQAGNDFDLYLYQDGAEVARADVDAPEDPQETREVLVRAALPPGDYAFLVVGSTMALDTYTLRADFS
jgi:hypothetical protein